MTVSDHEALHFVASECVADVLRDMSSTHRLKLSDALARRAEPSRVPYLTENFVRLNFVTPPDLEVSPRGRACDCGVAVIDGGSVLEIVDRLREIDPASNRVSLVREGMTNLFLDQVRRLDSIRRIMICSPWVSLSNDRLRTLAFGIERSRRERGFLPEITVVTRPVEDQPNGAQNETLAYFKRIGAVVHPRPNLHSKLYIVEAATTPPLRQAFVGSENFTKVRYQEVGIRVNNDNQLVDDLIRYFLSLI